jgi:hypothetical protein
MTEHLSKSCTAFQGSRLLSSGPLIEVVLVVKNATDHGEAAPLFVFDDATGRVIDLDLRGTKADVIARLSQPSTTSTGQAKSRRAASVAASRSASLNASKEPLAEPRGRGRPKLGVIGREVTLLPRQWEWLATQPGGASVVLRKLVEEARRTGGAAHKIRSAHEAAYHFMSAMAGNLPGFEEATRALFANDRPQFEQQVSHWPEGLRVYAVRLAFTESADGSASE